MRYYPYRWCVVAECKNTSIKTPGKLWIQIPTDVTMRKTWLKLARILSEKSRLYFCEDHFDLETDMENYMQYKVMGSVKRIRMKPHCIPSRLDCQADRKRKTTEKLVDKYIVEASSSCVKDSKIAVNISHPNIEASSSCIEDSKITVNISCPENNLDKAVQVFPVQDHKAIQVCRKAHYRSRKMQTAVRKKDSITSLFKLSISTSTSPLKMTAESAIKPSTSQSTVSKKLFVIEEKYDSDTSCTPSISGATVDHESSPCKLSSLSKTTSDTSSQEEYQNLEKLNLNSTFSKIKNNPKLYIGLPKALYFLIQLINHHTGTSEHNIMLCLMKIKLNRTFSQLADDFDLSVTQVSNIFFNKMPGIVKVLSPMLKQFSIVTIKKNLPIAFRHKYSQVTCIIDCLEIEIQKRSKAIHQALTWSEYKKTNTMKYLISCTPDGLVSFVSDGYAGRISDVNLLEDCKFLESLQPGACIIADRGFKHLELYLSQNGFVLLRPPSVTGGTKLSKAEVQQTKQIASLRIHVERVIRRLREFAMLKMHSAINSNLIGM